MLQNSWGVNILLLKCQQGWKPSERSKGSLERSVCSEPSPAASDQAWTVSGAPAGDPIFEPLSADKEDTFLEKAAAPIGK